MKTSCAALLLAFLALPSVAGAECGSGTAIVVRHGEKFMTGDAEKDRDAPLSEAGKERAEALAAALSEAGIDAVYSSPYLRTRGTVEPLAAKLGLEVVPYSVVEKDAQQRIAAKVMAENCGREVLIAGHSNTVPELLRAFGVAEPEEIADQQYDHLYLVRWRAGAPAELLVLHYGRPTP
jgi:2,3-bisphosphoglycerate-dependent phosphoglycerate mutase